VTVVLVLMGTGATVAALTWPGARAYRQLNEDVPSSTTMTDDLDQQDPATTDPVIEERTFLYKTMTEYEDRIRSVLHDFKTHLSDQYVRKNDITDQNSRIELLLREATTVMRYQAELIATLEQQRLAAGADHSNEDASNLAQWAEAGGGEWHDGEWTPVDDDHDDHVDVDQSEPTPTRSLLEAKTSAVANDGSHTEVVTTGYDECTPFTEGTAWSKLSRNDIMRMVPAACLYLFKGKLDVDTSVSDTDGAVS
jgi:hypothetical protein